MSGGGNSGPGIELQVKVSEGVNLNIQGDSLFQGVANVMSMAGKQLPQIPKMDFMNNSEDSFEKRYEERKIDQINQQSNFQQNNDLPQNPYFNQNPPPNPYMQQQNLEIQPAQAAINPNNSSMSSQQKQQQQPPNGMQPQLVQQFPEVYPPVSGGQPPQYMSVPLYNPDDDYQNDEVYQQYTSNQMKFYQIQYYSCYFNVSTMDVLHRLRKSIWPFCSKTTLFEDEDKIDLYGPIWIMITLIVEIAIVGFIDYQIEIATLAIELQSGKIPKNRLAYYSLEKVARAGFVCIGYFILNPLLLLLLIKYVLWIPDIKYLWLFAIYGYSFTIFIITTALNVVPIDWLRWVFLGVSGVSSLLFIWMEMYTLVKFKLEQNILKFIVICFILLITHGIFILALKKYFLA